MRFALLGNHLDGLALARALIDSGSHELCAFTSVESAEALLLRTPHTARRTPHATDLEEILADPSIDAVIVASPLADRPVLLRRALQSERHVLCVHPADQRPETAYEAGMIRQDVRRVLLPLLPEASHPALRRLAEFIDLTTASMLSPVGTFRLLEVERAATGEVLYNLDIAGAKPCFPGWDVLRRLGGEIAELSAFTLDEELGPGDVVVLAGRFERGGLFQETLLPRQLDERCRVTVVGERGRAELLLPQGWDGSAQLGWRDPDGTYREEYWDRWDPWPILIERFETAVGAKPDGEALAADWQHEIRALELDDSARRSVQKRRTSLLEYPEASEEVGFKGTMTLVGCAMLWLVLLLLIVSRWVPVAGWLIVPLIAVFLGMQFLRYAVPEKEKKSGGEG